jgi:hypothetical protein
MFGRFSQNFRGHGNVRTFFCENVRKIDNCCEKLKRNFVQVGEISYFRENGKKHFGFNLLLMLIADPDDVDCHSGGLQRINCTVPNTVDPELCPVVDDCHSGGLLLIYVPDAVDLCT